MRLAFLVALGLAACGRVGGDPMNNPLPDAMVDANPGTYTLAIASTDISGFRGSTISVPFRVDRSGGFQGDVALELVSPPNGFSGTFAPNPVPAGTEDVVATIVTPRVIGANPTPLQVAATASVGGRTLDLSLTLNSQNISGKVVTIFGGLAVTGTLVTIPGTGETTVNADGTFAIAGSHVPYEIIIKAPGVTGRSMYVGLTRPDPVVRDWTWFGLGPPPFPPHNAPIDLTIAGVVAADCNSTKIKMWMDVEGKAETVFLTPAFGTSCKVTGMANWDGNGSTTVTATYHVLTGAPAGPYAHNTQAITLTHNNATPVVFTVTPAAVPTGMVQGVVGIPPMATMLSMNLGLQSGTIDVAQLFVTMNAGEAVFPKPVPVIAGLNYQVFLNVTTMGGSVAHLSRDQLVVDVSNDFVLNPPANPVAPAHLATNVDEQTIFSWSPHTGTSTYKITAESVTQCGIGAQECVESRLTVFTQATSTTLPVKAPIPTGDYVWLIEANSPVTIDQTAALAVGFGDFRDNTTFTSNFANRFRFTFAP